MTNEKKTYIFTTLYNVGYMFCTGAIVQTFLLQAGFSEQQVYLYNSLTQILQVIMMVAMMFLSPKIKRVKLLTGISYLSLCILALVFLGGAFNPSWLGKSYVITVFIVAAVCYLGVGAYSVLSYCLPYATIDMKNYGKMMGLQMVFAGGASFALSFLHTFIVSKFNYMQAMTWFFVLAIVSFVITSALCISMKELKRESSLPTSSKKELIAVFKNKDTYILLLPNFVRGIATGVVGVITVIAISSAILDEKTSSYVNIVMQIAMFAGNLVYAFTCKKFSSKNLLLLATVSASCVLPFCLAFGTVGFLVVFFVAYFFRMIMDTAIPVVVTEIIPQEQIGAYTSIRMLVFTGAQAVATLIITPIVSIVGYIGLLIFASIMQFICGVAYYLVAKRKLKNVKNESSEIENVAE